MEEVSGFFRPLPLTDSSRFLSDVDVTTASVSEWTFDGQLTKSNRNTYAVILCRSESYYHPSETKFDFTKEKGSLLKPLFLLFSLRLILSIVLSWKTVAVR